MLSAMARRVQELGVRPELEVFDTGHMVLVKELMRDGLLDDPVMIQLCTGIPYGAPDDPGTLLAMVALLPAGRGLLGLLDRPHAAAVRGDGAARRAATCASGLEDNVYLSRGVLASNGQLVERAVRILEAMNVRVLGPDEVRERLALRRHG